MPLVQNAGNAAYPARVARTQGRGFPSFPAACSAPSIRSAHSGRRSHRRCRSPPRPSPSIRSAPSGRRGEESRLLRQGAFHTQGEPQATGRKRPPAPGSLPRICAGHEGGGAHPAWPALPGVACICAGHEGGVCAPKGTGARQLKRMRTACHSLGTCPAGEIRGGHRSPEAPLSSAHTPRGERTQAMEDADRGNPCSGHGACRENQERRWGRGRHRLLPPPPRQETGLSPHPRDGHPHDSPKTLGNPNAAGTMLHSEKPQPKTLPPPSTPDVIQKKSPKRQLAEL